ncbi:outer membrane beta-barrel family protein [Prevotella jejuni]|jgi:hypothetical protein|uniref:outer membrane beta-barrel family protein n=1 Tax=Prevotella jejuni TaxID=1177574 RepID=UPI003211A569
MKKYLICLIVMQGTLYGMAQNVTKDSTRAEKTNKFDSTQVLKEVVIKAYRPVSRVTREGFTYSVKGTPLALSGSLTDVLEQMPMVKKGLGGFEVVGKGTAVFYLNGRRMYDISELNSIAAKDVKNVEIITSPGAQYDSSISSIIKITTTSNDLEGLTVDARSTWYQNRHCSWIGQLDMHYITKRWTIYDNIKYQTDNDLTWKDLTQTVYADSLWHEVSAESEYRKQRKLTNIFGIDYKFSEGIFIGGRYSLTYGFRNSMFLESTNDIMANESHYDFLMTTGEERAHKRPQHLFNIYYSGKLSGYTLNADVDYLTNSVVKDNVYTEISEANANRMIDALSNVRNRMLSLRTSIGHKLFGGDTTIGMEYRDTKRNDDYTNSGEYIPTSISLLKETLYAPFVDYSVLTKIGLFGLGVRMESTKFRYYANGEYVPEQSQSMTRLFPKLSWGIRFGALQAQLKYSTGINRPTYRQLSSNILYGSLYTYQTGNPLLRPEYIHELTLQGSWRFIQFQATYSDTRNAIINWATQLESHPAVSVMSYKNLPSVRQIRLAMVFSRTFGTWSPQLTLAMNKQCLHLDTQLGTVSLNDPIWVVRFSNSLKVSPTLTMFLTANYQSTGDYRNVHLTHHVWSVNFNATKRFCHDRFSVQLKVDDIFNTQKDGNKIHSDRMIMNLLNTYDFRAISLTLRYQLHQKDYKHHQDGNVDEELRRL